MSGSNLERSVAGRQSLSLVYEKSAWPLGEIESREILGEIFFSSRSAANQPIRGAHSDRRFAAGLYSSRAGLRWIVGAEIFGFGDRIDEDGRRVSRYRKPPRSLYLHRRQPLRS